jgi:hypothetical protein
MVSPPAGQAAGHRAGQAVSTDNYRSLQLQYQRGQQPPLGIAPSLERGAGVSHSARQGRLDELR